MENSSANQLPEVDSLPDGFVESTAESIAPVTPSNEKREPLNDYQEQRFDKSESLDFMSSEMIVKESVVGQGKGEKLSKVRTFPVALSDKDGYDASGESACVSDDGVGRDSTISTSAVSEGSDLRSSNINSQTEFPCSKGIGESDVETPLKNAESAETRKEIPDVKRKSSKRSLKTEQEFLEFTLKYKHVLTERDAAIAVRDKLESLCRELQRQNKTLMDEFKNVSEEGRAVRLELSTKFEDAIKEVSNKLDEQKRESLSQLKDNEMLRENLKQLAEQYTLSQQQYAQEIKKKTLELKLAELKLQQNEEKLATEKAQMKVYTEKISQLLETEESLRLQLSADGEKFQQFQEALLKSNEVFETFKQEMDKMGNSSKELKKENTFLKTKCERSDFTLIELVEERERMKKQLEKTKNQKDKLESLCRSLQAERKQTSEGPSRAKSVQLQE